MVLPPLSEAAGEGEEGHGLLPASPDVQAEGRPRIEPVLDSSADAIAKPGPSEWLARAGGWLDGTPVRAAPDLPGVSKDEEVDSTCLGWLPDRLARLDGEEEGVAATIAKVAKPAVVVASAQPREFVKWNHAIGFDVPLIAEKTNRERGEVTAERQVSTQVDLQFTPARSRSGRQSIQRLRAPSEPGDVEQSQRECPSPGEASCIIPAVDVEKASPPQGLHGCVEPREAPLGKQLPNGKVVRPLLPARIGVAVGGVERQTGEEARCELPTQLGMVAALILREVGLRRKRGQWADSEEVVPSP